MFNVEDVGRSIKILDTNDADWLVKGNIYKIKEVRDRYTVKLDDNFAGAWRAKPNCYQFVNIDNKLQIGDEILIETGTQSIKEGSIKKVVGFLNNDKSKIVVEGLLPAGWVKSEYAVRLPPIKEYRLKTYLEFIKSFGFDIDSILGVKNTHIQEIEFGKPLEELNVERERASLVYRTRNLCFYLIEDFLEEINKQKEDLDIYIISKEQMKRIVTGENVYYKKFSEFENTKLSGIIDVKSEKDLIKSLSNNIETKIGLLPRAFLEIRSNKEKNEKIPIPDHILPF